MGFQRGCPSLSMSVGNVFSPLAMFEPWGIPDGAMTSAWDIRLTLHRTALQGMDIDASTSALLVCHRCAVGESTRQPSYPPTSRGPWTFSRSFTGT